MIKRIVFLLAVSPLIVVAFVGTLFAIGMSKLIEEIT